MQVTMNELLRSKPKPSMTESHVSFCSQWEYISHACKTMCSVTPGKNENIPQASFIHPSQCTFYPAWWLKQSSKCFGFFFSQGHSLGEWVNWTWISHSLRECIAHGATVKRINSEKWDCLLVFRKDKLTSRISQHPDIGEMPKCFFDICILNSVNLWGKTKVLFSTPASHSCACLPYENVYICLLIGKGKT